MKYLRSTRGRTIALAICVVCTVLLVVAFAVLKPTVVDLWYRHQLRSSDPEVRAQAVEALCANPSPRAARELMRMFKQEDESASSAVLGAGDPGLLPYLLEAVRSEASWFLRSLPPREGKELRELLDYGGADYFRPGCPIRHSGEPAPRALESLDRVVQVVARILEREGSSELLNDLRGLDDAALLIVFSALCSDEETLNALACRWHPVGLASRSWLVRSVTLDALHARSPSSERCPDLETPEILACVRDHNFVLQAKAVGVAEAESVVLPDEVIPRFAPLLLDRWKWRSATKALSHVAPKESSRHVLFGSMNSVYAKYLADPSVAPEANGYGFQNAIHDIAGALFNCRDVPDLIQRLSLPAGQCEFSLEALVALTPECELPRSTVDAVKRFVGSHQYPVRIAALFLCANLRGIDQQLTTLLLEAARDEDVSIRGAALIALGDDRLVDDLALQVFGNALKDDSWYCRDIAISQLEDLGERARKPLLDSLETVRKKEPGEDDDPNLVKKLEAALERLNAPEASSEE